MGHEEHPLNNDYPNRTRRTAVFLRISEKVSQMPLLGGMPWAGQGWAKPQAGT